MKSRFNLLTIRSSDIDRAVCFYEALGLRFSKHAHGTGPEHYCSQDAGIVFEIYPLRPGKIPTTDARIGFAVASVEAATAALSALGARVVSAPAESEWGRCAVIADFDGHRVELTESVYRVEVPPGASTPITISPLETRRSKSAVEKGDGRPKSEM